MDIGSALELIVIPTRRTNCRVIFDSNVPCDCQRSNNFGAFCVFKLIVRHGPRILVGMMRYIVMVVL